MIFLCFVVNFTIKLMLYRCLLLLIVCLLLFRFVVGLLLVYLWVPAVCSLITAFGLIIGWLVDLRIETWF